ncbi:unnamed protein product [Lactuca saligna]|uniref:Uncharacterized protein n=1 Tax=Lactuca saligna TaxID=75948 RepID=A0AA36E4S9_LACSI|nr:unnamed protein product [Lactuca saligna]
MLLRIQTHEDTASCEAVTGEAATGTTDWSSGVDLDDQRRDSIGEPRMKLTKDFLGENRMTKVYPKPKIFTLYPTPKKIGLPKYPKKVTRYSKKPGGKKEEDGYVRMFVWDERERGRWVVRMDFIFKENWWISRSDDDDPRGGSTTISRGEETTTGGIRRK